jgi:ceramide glucosyltransferase
MLSYLLLALAALGTLSSTAFLVLALIAALHHRRKLREPSNNSVFPAVSVLKPVHGMEPRLRENLESFFQIDYPDFELLFCARRRDDAALTLVDKLAAQYPGVQVRVLASGDPPYANAKVYSLAKLIDAAQHELLVISDSDVAVSRAYLREIAPDLLDRSVGVVTCLYRGLPVEGFWARLEALGMSVEMTSGVLIAEMLEGVRFALGPTMATRKDVIARIGGVAQLGDFASDDYLLGNLADAAGLRNGISPHFIDHVVFHRTWLESWRHQVRWMKTTRYSRPKGHFGTGLTFAMPFGLLGLAGGLLLGNLPLAWGLFGWAVANRVIQSIAIGWGVVSDPRALAFAWLYPLRDLLGFFLWVASYGSNIIEWRGETYRMEFGGKMRKLNVDSKAQASHPTR